MSELSAAEVQKTLPHRYPMLLVDRVVECDDKRRIVAIKNVTINEPFFQGHFPGAPIMPGVLQLEAMAQAGGILINRVVGGVGKIPYFLGIDKARFRRPVRPGDQLRIEVEITQMRTRAVRFVGKVHVGEELASEAELMCMLSDEDVATQ